MGVRTWDGWAYIASVIDGYSHKVIGWAIADHMRTELVIDALTMAIERRQPHRGVIFHADRDSQYTSSAFVEFCTKRGIRNSVGRTGICFDCETAVVAGAGVTLATTGPAGALGLICRLAPATRQRWRAERAVTS